MNKRREAYSKVVSRNSDVLIKPPKIESHISFETTAMKLRRDRRNNNRDTQIELIEKWSRKQKTEKKSVIRQTVDMTSKKKNAKIEKLKKNPRLFFKDSKLPFFVYLQYLFREKK